MRIVLPLGQRFGQAYHMAIAGPVWIDFSIAEKGSGLRKLCASLGVELSDAAASGDNWNDVTMLESAGTP